MGREKILIAVLGILFMVVMPVWGEVIHDAAKEGDIAKIESLLAEKPEKINAKDEDGRTPLHYAAMGGHKDIVKLLIAKGADVNVKDKDGYTPFIVKGEDVNANRYQYQDLMYERGSISIKDEGMRQNKMMEVRTRSDLGMRLDIKFDYNSDRIRIESYFSLDDIAEYMKSSQRQNVKFIIEGHTDERGTAEYNKLLSQKRAESTKRYLVEKHGIDPNRLITRGFGEERPLNRAHNEQAWAKNRRVMLKAESMNKAEVTLRPKNKENINIIMFANTSSKNTQIRKKLSRLTSNLVSLQSFPEVRLVSVVTDEDCTRNEVSKKLKKNKGKINIIILVGDILYNSSNRAYFKTIDTDLDILEDSAVSISQIREKLVGGQDSIIVVTNHLINFSEQGDPNIKEKRRAIPMASVETPIESQLGLLEKLIQKMKTDLSGGIQDQPLLESIFSFCLETRDRHSPNG